MQLVHIFILLLSLLDEVAAEHIRCEATALCILFWDHRRKSTAHRKYFRHDFEDHRCYPRSAPTFFIPIHSCIASLWLSTASCPFCIVKGTIVPFFFMLLDLLILSSSWNGPLVSWSKMPTDSTSTLQASSMLWSAPPLIKQPLLLSDWIKNWSVSHYALPNTKLLVTTECRKDVANVLVLTSLVHWRRCRQSSSKRASS